MRVAWRATGCCGCANSWHLDFCQQGHHLRPHVRSTLVHIALGVSEYRCIGRKLKSVEDDARSFAHRLLHRCDIALEPIEGRADEDRVVHWRTDVDAALGGKAAGEPEQLRAVSL